MYISRTAHTARPTRHGTGATATPQPATSAHRRLEPGEAERRNPFLPPTQNEFFIRIATVL